MSDGVKVLPKHVFGSFGEVAILRLEPLHVTLRVSL